MLKGRLLATTDFNDVVQASNAGFKILYVGDILESPTGVRGMINAVPFTPNYQSLSKVIEGDFQTFDMMYVDSLRHSAAQELIAIIVMALVNGTNILMYFPPDTMQLRYPYILKSYLEKYQGIVFEFNNPRSFAYSQEFNFANTKLVYMYNMIDVMTFIKATDGCQYYPGLLVKLREDVAQTFGINTSMDIMTDQEFVMLVDQIRHSHLAPQNNPQIQTPVSPMDNSNNGAQIPIKPEPPKKKRLFEVVS